MNAKNNKNNYIAIILAAGLSSRMAEFKPLVDINGKSALSRLLDTIEASGLKQAVVVTGHKQALIDEALRKRQASASACGLVLAAAHNPNYESGMFSSVQTGIRHIVEKPFVITAALLFPADVPLVSAETIRGLIAAYEQAELSCFAVPVCEEKNGHPLLIPCIYFSEILDHAGEGGLKEIRNRHIAKMIRYRVVDEGCVLDIDTPEDHEKMLAYEKRQNER